MCYPKPGPRCSAHAREEVTRLEDVVNNFAPESRTFENVSYFNAWNDLQEARAIYDSTVEGWKKLVAQAEETDDILERTRLEERIHRGVALREHQKESYRLRQIANVQEAKESIEMARSGISIHSATDLERAEMELELAENGGMAEFPALFDTEGNRIPNARLVDTRYGRSWVIDNGEGKEPTWFSPSSAKDGERRKNTDAKKGYYVGRVKSLARIQREYPANSRYNLTSFLTVKRAERHGGTEGDVVLDNGRDILPEDTSTDSATNSAVTA